MKDSGIEWIGEIPEDWELIKIGSIFRCRNEKVNDTDYPPLSVTRNGIVPQMENVAKTNANDNRKMVKVKDFVINSRSDRKQSCGVSPLEGSVSLINTVLFTEDADVIIPKYTNIIMKNYGFAEEFYRWGHGIVADLWTTCWQEMKSIVLPLPTVQQQKKIVEFVQNKISKIDSLIAHEEATIEELKAYKQSVITEAVTKGLDESKKHSRLKFLLSKKLSYGTNLAGGIYNNRFPRYIRITDIHEERLIDEIEKMQSYYEDDATNYLVEVNDILFARSGATAGKTYLGRISSFK